MQLELHSNFRVVAIYAPRRVTMRQSTVPAPEIARPTDGYLRNGPGRPVRRILSGGGHSRRHCKLRASP